ncbi:MAG: flagellar FlbD family protein [Deltaproteobacteria bacterium]
MIKLTRLNQQTVVINPDHIGCVESTPDTTLFLIGGEKIIVRETLDELIAAVIRFRREVRLLPIGDDGMTEREGNPPPMRPARRSEHPRESTMHDSGRLPRNGGGDR